MSAKYYKGNDIDITTKDQLSGEILNKVVEQLIETKKYEDVFGIFTSHGLEVGNQIEEDEVANLSPEDFDPTGAGALTKKDLSVANIYHKKNRRGVFKTTKSDKQIRMSMMSREKVAEIGNAIINELFNSDAIADYEAFKQLLVDVCQEKKNMVICDLNDNSTKIDAVVKAVKIIARNMTFPSTAYNYLGFKKEFNAYDDCVLIMDSSMEAVLDVDSLASAFHMDKKSLVKNIVVIDKMPAIEYAGVKVDAGETIEIGEQKPILTMKYNSGGSGTVTGKAKMILCDRRALKRIIAEKKVTEQYNGAGDFHNYWLHFEECLSYSPLRNAVVFVD